MGRFLCRFLREEFIMVRECLEYLHKNYRCKLFSPIEGNVIDKFAEIKEYHNLLHISNGIVCNGVEILGAVPVVRVEKGYSLPDVVTMSERFGRYDFFRDKIVIGQAYESLIYYDMSKSVYGISSRINFDEQMVFDSLLQLLDFFFPVN